ncbi:MAG: helix-turn-helix domain-containing protein, partial [Selenomonadaceae bacterium]|nr:helix-turn-helix domain-containing protein [Selenomonadaceae bacterium]
MNQTFGNVRYVYNYFLNERKRAYIEEKKTLSLYETQSYKFFLQKLKILLAIF